MANGMMPLTKESLCNLHSTVANFQVSSEWTCYQVRIHLVKICSTINISNAAILVICISPFTDAIR